MNKKTPNEQVFESIRVVGGLLTTQVLSEARKYTLPGQTPEDYRVPKGLKMADELGRYWRIAQSHWQTYSEQCQRTDIHPERVAMKPWLLPLLQDVLGYQIERAHPNTSASVNFPSLI